MTSPSLPIMITRHAKLTWPANSEQGKLANSQHDLSTRSNHKLKTSSGNDNTSLLESIFHYTLAT